MFLCAWVCAGTHGYAARLLQERSCILPTATWLFVKIKAVSHNEVCLCERPYSVVFSSPGYIWENAISCYLAPHHQTHISYLHFLRVNGDKDHILPLELINQSGESVVSFSILVKYCVYYKVNLGMWSGAHSRKATVFLWCSVHEKKNL